MAMLSSTLLEIAVLAAAGLLYALIWYTTRGLPAPAKGLARAVPLIVIVPAVLYLSFSLLLQPERVGTAPDAGAARRTTAVRNGDTGAAPQGGAAKSQHEPAPTQAPPVPRPDASPPPSQPSPARSAKTGTSDTADSAKGGPAPGVPAAAQTDWDVVPVFYGTDRVRKDESKRIAYSADRARRLELGRALVTVPKAHQVPNIERPFAIRVPYFQVTLYERAEDPKQHFTISELKALSRADFLALVRERIGGGRAFKDQAVVFVHGYNTAFDYALYRTAQMAYDLKFDGAAFLYSWPSGGGVAGYGYDRESATQTEPHLKEFLALVLKDSGAKSVSVIAHSMGNLPLLNVLRDLGPSLPPGVRLNEIILAAPDVDRDVFAFLAANIRQYGRGVTLYCSANDRAMAASRRVAGGVPRAGDVPADGPIVITGIDTIDVTQTSTDVLALNHSSYAEKSALLNDIGLLLLTGERPPERRIPILQKISTPKGDFWRYPLP
ncbi:MAG: alpha/beta hydrolase [Hyphomonadaceae bacterium]|nr:alpha/beta hydrolase [Hyphomonadaceae bacterium]